MIVDQIVIRVKELVVGKLPKCYGENGDNIWEAFHLGEKYAALKQQKSVAPAPNSDMVKCLCLLGCSRLLENGGTCQPSANSYVTECGGYSGTSA